MHRNWFVLALGLLAFAWIGAPAANADDGALLQENQQLRERVDALESERDALLNQEIEEYLDEADVAGAAQAAGGDAFSRMDTSVDVTVVIQILTDNNAGSPGVMSADIDWTWTYHATDNMDIWLELNIATVGSGFPSQFPGIGPTGSGVDDGLGVNANENRASGGSNVNLYQGGMHMWGDSGESRWHLWIAKIDPRRHFLQNAFAHDEETQWLNDLFISTSANTWRTGNVAGGGTAGTAQLGTIFRLEFGTDHNMWLTAGYWNGAGRWFDNGKGGLEWGLKHQVSGRDANLRIFLSIDTATNIDDLISAGLSWDWWVTEAIGLFVKANWNNADATTPAHIVEVDISIGAIWYGPMESRPNDQWGLAVGTNMPNDDVVGPGLDDEIVIETYYRYQVDAQNGKLYVTVGIQIILDPAGAAANFGGEDTALLVHLRVHGTF